MISSFCLPIKCLLQICDNYIILLTVVFTYIYVYISLALPAKLLSANATKPHWWYVNTGSGNCVMSSSNKPLPEPILTKFYDDIRHHQAYDEFINITKSYVSIHTHTGRNENLWQNAFQRLMGVLPFINTLRHVTPFKWTFIPDWISNYIHYKVWNEITYPVPNFNGEV